MFIVLQRIFKAYEHTQAKIKKKQTWLKILELDKSILKFKVG